MKCPICDHDFHELSSETKFIIKALKKEPDKCLHNEKDLIKEIERLKKLCSETGINVLHDKMVEVVQYVSEKLNPETIVYKDLSIILEFED